MNFMHGHDLENKKWTLVSKIDHHISQSIKYFIYILPEKTYDCMLFYNKLLKKFQIYSSGFILCGGQA